MKRFTETEKWRDPWFFNLSPKHKFLWLWILDKVDNSGVIDIHWAVASFETGFKLCKKDIAPLLSRIECLDSGKYLVSKFVVFQFGELTENSPVHRSVMKLQKNHRLSIPY